MGDQEEGLTAAQKQILRLEKLRAEREQSSKASVEKTFSSAKTGAEQSIQKLESMRDVAKKSNVKKKLEGKIKSFKSSSIQTQVLERLKAQDRRLNGATVTRIALNRFLNIENSFDENE